MARYSAGVVTPAAAAGAAYATIHTGAGARCRIQELGIFAQAATATRVAIGRPTNTPVANASVLGQAEDPADAASTVNVDTGWSTAPTMPTIPLRRGEVAAAIGAAFIWSWSPGKELIIPVSSWLVIWNDHATLAGSACSLYIVWEE